MPIDADNLAHWNEVTPHHVASPMYRTEDFRRGEIVLDPVVRDAIGDVAGKRLLHLQCHFGLDTLSLARMGAQVTGLDFSPVAIEQARALAAEAGIDASFVCADVLAPPAGLTGFDIVFASWGAIFWIGDLGAWMRVAAGALKQGGRLFLTEGHPAMLMLDERAPPGAPMTVRWPWDCRPTGRRRGRPRLYRRQGRGEPHAGLPARPGAHPERGDGRWPHSIRAYSEGDRVPWKAMDQLVKLDRDYWALPPGAPAVPLSFTLQAAKSA